LTRADPFAAPVRWRKTATVATDRTRFFMSDISPFRRRLHQSLHTFASWKPVQTVGRGLNVLAEYGTEGYEPDAKRRLMILNMIAGLIAVTTLVYAIQHTFLDYEKYKPVILINIGLVFSAMLVPLSHRYGELAGAMIILVSEYIALFAFALYLGRSAGVQTQYFIAAAAPFVVLGLNRMWLIVPIILVGIGLHLLAWFGAPDTFARIHADPDVIDSIYTQAAITTFALIAASVYYAFRLAEKAKAEVDALLRNILPDNVVERLKSKPNAAIADSVESATILFADISGFVALARHLGAEKTVATLNNIVTGFDALTEKHGVEKIKTIGDAYMAAAGVPERSVDHTARVARLALDMQRSLQQLRDDTGLDLNMRIGVATGPVMAGVIGRKKFNYDIWGDAVNLAARLEGLSRPGRILMCPGCKAAIAEDFEFESRGMVEVKGVGPQEAWFLIRKCSA
jgi:adenylate cyclase